MYSPEGDSPDEILKESTGKLSVWRHDDKKTLQSHLLIYDYVSSIVKAALLEDGTTISNFADRVRQSAGGLQVRATDLDAFLERVETGFTDASGNTEATPYGRPYDERPRIRKVDGRAEGGDNT